MKILDYKKVTKFEHMPNIGTQMAKDFRLLGFKTPQDLAGKDPLKLYRQIENITGSKHDPCVLDTYMAAVDFMNGAEPMPWWHYTPKRKALLNVKANYRFE